MTTYFVELPPAAGGGGGVPTSRAINTTAPLTGGGDLTGDRTLAITKADATHDGYLAQADWSTFNNKQAAGSYITALTGDVTATGPGSVAATIAALAVTNGKLAASAVDNSKVAVGAAIAVNKLAALTASRAVATDASGFVSASAVTSTELGFISGVTSSVQTQLDSKTTGPGTSVDGEVALWNGTSGGILKRATGTGVAHLTSGVLSVANVNMASEVTGVLPVANGGTNSSTALSNNRVIISSGSALVESAAITANRALTSNASGIPVASATTDTELGFVSGVTSSIQTQLNGKQATGNYITALTGDVTASGPGSAAASIAAGAVDNSKVSNTAAIALTKLAATTASRALVSDASGFISPATTTSTEIGYVNGVTSAIQTQLNGKEPSITSGTTSQYWRGDKSFQTLNVAAITAVVDGSSAATGQIGETLSSVQSTNTTTGVGASGVYGNVTNVSLTAGEWEIYGVAGFNENGATLQAGLQCGISSSSSGAGIDEFDTTLAPFLISGSSDALLTTPRITVDLAGTTTYYLNTKFTYSAGTPKHRGKIFAKRTR